MKENVMNRKALWNAEGGEVVQDRKRDGRARAPQRTPMTASVIFGAVLLIGALVTPLLAQTYPTTPIRLILPFATGGGSDIVGRVAGPLLAERLVHPSVPVKNLKELVAYARANPGKLNCGTSGVGGPGHLAGELLKSLAKIDVMFVAYKSVGAAIIALMSGEVQMMLSNTAAALPQVQAGKVRALAVLSNKRLSSLPDVPTTKEAGIDNYEVMVWYGFLVPAESEIARWGKVVKEANIPTLD